MRRMNASLRQFEEMDEASVTISQLFRDAPGWLLDGQYRQLSPQPLAARRFLVDKLLWFLRQQEYSQCGVPELRAFLAYISTAHEQEGGRWDNAAAKAIPSPRSGLDKTSGGSATTAHRWKRRSELLQRYGAEGVQRACQVSGDAVMGPPMVSVSTLEADSLRWQEG